jgi:hypothetical protein
MFKRSIMPNILIELIRPFKRGVNHLTEHRLLLPQLGELFLKVIILFLLIHHSQLQLSIQSFDQWHCGIGYLIVCITYFGLK